MIKWFRRQQRAVKFAIAGAGAFWIIAGIALGVVGYELTRGPAMHRWYPPARASSDSQTIPPTPVTTSAPEQNNVGIGQALTVDNIQITAGNPEKHSQFTSDNMFIDPASANGIYILIPLTIENVGTSPVEISTDQLILSDKNSRLFKSVDMTDYNLGMIETGLLTYQQLNPNVPVTTEIVFDVPKDAAGLMLMVGNRRYNPSNIGGIKLGI